MEKPLLALLSCAILAGCASQPVPDPSTPSPEPQSDYALRLDQSSKAQNARVHQLVLHYTALGMADSLRVLSGDGVSAHYLVPDKPEVSHDLPVAYRLVDEDKRAWHAGTSRWKSRSHVNDTSIGIEIVNAGWDRATGRPLGEAFSDEQIELVIRLARDLVKRYDIAPTDVIGHADIAPTRKVDPGPQFPWERLAAAGVGAWPDSATQDAYRARFESQPPSAAQVDAALSRYGYNYLDEDRTEVIRAFQMHFRPAAITGAADAETLGILFALVDKYYGAKVAGDLLRRT